MIARQAFMILFYTMSEILNLHAIPIAWFDTVSAVLCKHYNYNTAPQGLSYSTYMCRVTALL